MTRAVTRSEVRSALDAALAPWGVTVDSGRSLAECGFGSIDYIQLARGVSERLDIALPVGKLFMHPNLPELEAVVAELAGVTHGAGETGTAPATPAVPGPEQGHGSGDVAVCGMACQLPPDVASPDACWEALVEQRDCCSEIARARPWLVEQHLNDHDDLAALPTRAGIAQGMDEFDASFFKISPFEAEAMDPQQRRLLEVVWHALEDSGQQPSRLRGGSVGVYVGAQIVDYRDVARLTPGSADVYGGHLDSGTHASMLANRVSRWYDFRGPSIVVNTACSSSGVALHLAVRALRAAEIDTAIVAGTNYLGSAASLMCNNMAGMQSVDGRCKTFDAAADGYVRSEGVVAIVLKRVSDCENHRVRAVVKGTAVNQDGTTGSLRAPNPRAQAELVRAALRDAGVEPEQVGMVECHGTGTPLGDPIEVEGLNDALAPASSKSRVPALLTSAKTVFGHLEPVAGLVSVMKAVLCLEHGVVPGLGHFRQVNPDLAPDPGSLALAVANTPWPAPATQPYACISSFGFGGANAHVVLGPAPRRAARTSPLPKLLPVLLSAQTTAALERRLHQVHDLLVRSSREQMEQLVLGLLAAEPMPHRLALAAADAREAATALMGFVGGGQQGPSVFAGVSPEPTVDRAPQHSDRGVAEPTPDLLQAWVQGEATPWDDIMPTGEPSPPYPFTPDRHWLEVPGTRSQDPARLHGFVLRNVSDLREQCFESVWEGSAHAPGLHRKDQEWAVPPAVWLEVARFCFETATAQHCPEVLLEDLVWGEALLVPRGERIRTRTVVGARPDGRVDVDVLRESSDEVLFQATASARAGDGWAVAPSLVAETGDRAPAELIAALHARGVRREGPFDTVATVRGSVGRVRATLEGLPAHHGLGRNIVCDVYAATSALDLGWWALDPERTSPAPACAQRAVISGPTPRSSVVSAWADGDSAHVLLTSVGGQPVLRIEGLSFLPRQLEGKQ